MQSFFVGITQAKSSAPQILLGLHVLLFLARTRPLGHEQIAAIDVTLELAECRSPAVHK